MNNFAKKTGRKGLPRGKGRHGILIALIVLAIALFIVATPLVVVFLFGMVPTIVAMICDRDREKYTAIAIGAGNIAGVVPFLISLAMKGPTLARAGEIVTDIFSVAIMYGTAGAGWLFVAGLPSVVAVYMNVTTESRIQSLNKSQRDLVKEWGTEVGKSATPPDTGRR